MRSSLAALVAAMFATFVAAQANEQVIVHVEGRGDSARQVCSVKITPYAGSARSGGLGYVHVDAQNLDGRPHAVRVRFSSYTWIGSSIDAERTVTLLPHERSRFFLPLPGLPRYSFELVVTIDADNYVENMQAPRNRGNTALLISARPQLLPAVLALAQGIWPTSKSAKPAVTGCDPHDTPADWRLFTAFDLVVVDGRSEVTRELQEALRRYVHAGGRLLAIGADRLPAGALRELLEPVAGTETIPHGFGAMTATTVLGGDPLDLRHELAGGASSESMWPVDRSLQRPQVIPGLDRAPVLAFLFVILLFAIAVGPVNFYMLRKRKRPLFALVTVPALGFGTTLLMFGYAIMHDGFGVRGVERSWTLLDQHNHEASTISTRTLFAGLSPGSFELGDDSMLLAPGAFERPDSRSRHRWSYLGDTGTVDGAVLPARTPTVLISARQGVARERLRARLRGDGDLDLLTDGGVVPTGEVLLRDFDGQYWSGEAPRLVRCSRGQAGHKIERMRRGFRIHEVDSDSATEVVSLDLIAGRMLRDDQLPAGSYVATVSAAPWVPGHGVAVDYEARVHHVVGRLSPEDFVR